MDNDLLADVPKTGPESASPCRFEEQAFLRASTTGTRLKLAHAGTAQCRILPPHLEQNAKFANEANQRDVDNSQEVAKEKTQYLEKIALAAGGTLAIVVSFVGAHAGRLQPPWLLRTALVTLVLTLIVAMARNFRYHYYLMGLYGRKSAEASLDRERARRDYLVVVPSINPDTLTPNDPQAIREQFAEEEGTLNKKIAEFKKQEESAFRQTRRLEGAAVLLIVAAMGMLIALAWINF